MRRPPVCPWCGVRAEPVRVHGHGQCKNCGTNIEPCCDGAEAGSEVPDRALQPLQANPDLFPNLFARLGGERATITANALAFALVEQLAVDLPTARLVLEAGERSGQLQAPAPDCYRLAR